MTSENIKNIKKTSKITGRTTKITSKITERSTGTRSEKKTISHQKMSDSVPNCKHSLQKLKTQVLMPIGITENDTIKLENWSASKLL